MLTADPYHGGQAHGLAFSVRRGVSIPPSLQNIFSELETSVSDFVAPTHGCLERWCKQGVLLLNTVLTVSPGKPQSHAGRGWELFTDAIIRHVAQERRRIALVLWGDKAKKKQSLVDKKKHVVLTAAHPSPYSAHSGFFGCGHFKTLADLYKIDWSLE